MDFSKGWKFLSGLFQCLENQGAQFPMVGNVPGQVSMECKVSESVQRLIDHGVVLPAPASVEVGDEVNPAHIAAGVVIHAGCKVLGEETSVGPGCELGAEAPVTVNDCQLGHNVTLKGGFCEGSVFLDGASMGSGAHVRPGTLLEEEANGAHTVGLKQTLFLSFVTAGSLINFCDALMAGGTSRKDHSEIGSSFIHFNFTPHGDKATPSLIGDVPRGVMLREHPIFLGGQGGLVGPVRVEYGSVLPAGAIRRKDALEPDQLLPVTRPGGRGAKPYDMRTYASIDRVVRNNMIYIGNIHALLAWYRFARRLTMVGDDFQRACYKGGVRVLELVLAERVKRLAQFAEKVTESVEILGHKSASGAETPGLAGQQAFLEQWPACRERLEAGPEEDAGGKERRAFRSAWEKAADGRAHVEAVKALSDEDVAHGTAWLQAIVDATAAF